MSEYLVYFIWIDTVSWEYFLRHFKSCFMCCIIGKIHLSMKWSLGNLLSCQYFSINFCLFVSVFSFFSPINKEEQTFYKSFIAIPIDFKSFLVKHITYILIYVYVVLFLLDQKENLILNGCVFFLCLFVGRIKWNLPFCVPTRIRIPT